MTTLTTTRMTTTSVCKDPSCRFTENIAHMTMGYCPNCWERRQNGDDSNELTQVAEKLRAMLPEQSALSRSISRVLDDESRSFSPGIAARIVAFAYQYANQAGDSALRRTALRLKTVI